MNIRFHCLLAFLCLWPATGFAAGEAVDPVAGTLQPSANQAVALPLISGLFSGAGYALRPRVLDDQLSTEIFDSYLLDLDPEKRFFSQAEIKALLPYRKRLDDVIQQRDLAPAFDIFDRYLKAVDARVAFARKQLLAPMDFTASETWVPRRADAAWPVDTAALDELWRLSIKNDVLELKLAGKSPEKIHEILDARYLDLTRRVRQLRSEDVFETFVNAYIGTVDAGGGYYAPRSAAALVSPTTTGVGLSLRRDGPFMRVHSLVKGGPADVSGALKVGERVLAVGEASGEMVDVVGWRIDDVIERMRGEKGTTLRLQLQADDGSGKPRLVSLVRAVVRIEEDRARRTIITIAGKRIGVITLPAFYLDFEAVRRGDADARSSSSDVARLLAELKAENVAGVVMDLRDNGGGALTESTALTGLFIERPQVAQIRQSGSGGRISVEKADTARVWDGPLAVLVNHGSAAASEIFAASIQDHGRGLVLGSQTFGRGSVQSMIDLDRIRRGAALRFGMVKLSIAEVFRITGEGLDISGVTPDIHVPVIPGLDAAKPGQVPGREAMGSPRVPALSPLPEPMAASLLVKLSALHQQRLLGDAHLQAWRRTLDQCQAEIDQREVSLQESLRRAGLQAVATASTATGPTLSPCELARASAEDLPLQEAAALLADALDVTKP